MFPPLFKTFRNQFCMLMQSHIALWGIRCQIRQRTLISESKSTMLGYVLPTLRSNIFQTCSNRFKSRLISECTNVLLLWFFMNCWVHRVVCGRASSYLSRFSSLLIISLEFTSKRYVHEIMQLYVPIKNWIGRRFYLLQDIAWLHIDRCT